MGEPVLIVGSMALDSVKTPHGQARDVLGGAATYASVAASLFASPIRVVGVVGRDFPQEHLDFLASRGIDLTGVEKANGQTFRWSGAYGDDPNEAKTLDTQLNVFADFNPVLPESYRESPYVLLANIDPALQRKVLDQIRAPRLVIADTMNYWIENRRDDLVKTLSRVSMVILNDAEARSLTGERNLTVAARAIRAMGPRWALIKKGEHGAMLFGEDLTVSVPGFPLERVKDPTGAGDSFAGGFIGTLAAEGKTGERELRRALAVGAVVASFNIEEFSLERLRTLRRGDVDQRLHELRRIAHLGEGN